MFIESDRITKQINIYGHNLLMFEINWSVFPVQAFPTLLNV
jgi:hypothetical protein